MATDAAWPAGPADNARATRPVTSYRRYSIGRAQLASAYDVVIVGAGVGGLACGAYLAKAGVSVLVVERHSIPGGLCSFFKRRQFYFDAGAHFFGSLGDPRSFGGLLLRPLALDVEFIRIDPVDIFHFPDETVELPADYESHLALLQRSYPLEGPAIRAFFQKLMRIYRHFNRGKDDSEMLRRYRYASFQELLDEHFSDRKLKAVLSATAGYIGVNARQVSAIAMASMMMSYFYDGGYIARGGSQAIPDSLMRCLAGAGGQLLLNSPVKRIVIDDSGMATGIVLSSGERVRARVVVSNADARHTFCALIGEDRLPPEYLRVLQGYRESNSCFVLYLGVRCDDDMLRGKRGWYYNSYDMNDADNTPLYVAINSLEDRSLCPPGFHIVTATTLYAGEPATDGHRWYDDDRWTDYKVRCEQRTLAWLEQIIPGLSERVVVRESATRQTIYRYTASSRGAMYGWESSPGQVWLNRLPMNTPYDNLFLCGHWTAAGSGVISVIASGFRVARTVQGCCAGDGVAVAAVPRVTEM
jgi:phytoene dehydrogenase-like protein